jgi:twitching motility two-component system response regulator PilH
MVGKNILIVDDSPTERQITLNALKSLNCRVTTAASGEEALQQIQTRKPDLIILDVVMPGTNGFQLCRQIKSSAEMQGIKVILLTSKNQQADKFWGMKQGADLYVTKPFADEELVQSVMSLA